MVNTLYFLRFALKRHGLWLLAACIAVFSLQFVAVSWLALGDGGYPWQGTRLGVFAIVLALSVTLGLVLLVWLHRSIMSPMTGMVDDMGQLLDRARLMQTAMQPALKLLGDGMVRQGRMVDSLRQRLDSVLPPKLGNSMSPLSDNEKRSAYFATTLDNLRADITSRRDIAKTLAAASDSIGMRLRELEYTLARMRTMLSNHPSQNPGKSWENGGFGPGADEFPPYWENTSDAPQEPTMKREVTEPHSFNWPDETSRPLMSDFHFPDDTVKRRFEIP